MRGGVLEGRLKEVLSGALFWRFFFLMCFVSGSTTKQNFSLPCLLRTVNTIVWMKEQVSRCRPVENSEQRLLLKKVNDGYVQTWCNLALFRTSAELFYLIYLHPRLLSLQSSFANSETRFHHPGSPH